MKPLAVAYAMRAVCMSHAGSVFYLCLSRQVDPHGSLPHSLTSLRTGTKRWALYPPHVTPPGVRLRKEGGGVTGVDLSVQMTALRWFLEVYPGLSAEDRPHLEFVQQPGEVVYVPGGWWHCVLNLTTAVAVTQVGCA